MIEVEPDEAETEDAYVHGYIYGYIYWNRIMCD